MFSINYLLAVLVTAGWYSSTATALTITGLHEVAQSQVRLFTDFSAS